MRDLKFLKPSPNPSPSFLAGNLIILIMSNDADALHDSFLELAGDLAGEPISKEGKAQE
jgi:hypothetical protein